MIPAAAASKQNNNNNFSYSYGGCYGRFSDKDHISRPPGHDCCYFSETCLLSGSDILMAEEDESRTNSANNNEETGSSSKDNHPHLRDDEEWLQLRIGGGGGHDREIKSGEGLVELDLLNQQQAAAVTTRPVPAAAFHTLPRPIPLMFGSNMSLFLQQQQQQQIHNWPFMASSSSSSYLARPPPYDLHAGGGGLDRRSEMRIINYPPRRAGIWFMLQASQYQAKTPCLPQISKSYLRIKDGRRMTVGLIMKYLVNKLGLESESEVEITCRGQQLLPDLTLQHVRDNIWSSRGGGGDGGGGGGGGGGVPSPSPSSSSPSSPSPQIITLLPTSSTTDHLMLLRYGRS